MVEVDRPLDGRLQGQAVGRALVEGSGLLDVGAGGGPTRGKGRGDFEPLDRGGQPLAELGPIRSGEAQLR